MANLLPYAIRWALPLDKSAWAPGPWQDEPDLDHWLDDATGFPAS